MKEKGNGMDKADTKQRIPSQGTHRFDLGDGYFQSPDTPEHWRVWSKRVEQASKTLAHEIPAYAGMTLYGSYIRKAAGPTSDLDMRVYIDASHPSLGGEDNVLNRFVNPGRVVLQPRLDTDGKMFDQIATIIIRELQVPPERRTQFREGIVIHFISKNVILNTLSNLKRHAERKQTLGEAVSQEWWMWLLFALSTGRGLDKYRTFLLLELQKMGNMGEQIWKLLISQLEYSEQVEHNTGKKYPKTLLEATALYSR